MNAGEANGEDRNGDMGRSGQSVPSGNLIMYNWRPMTIMVKKVGGSVAVVIPKAVAHELQLREGTPLEISTTPDAIVMRKRGRAPRRSLKKIVAAISPASYRSRRRELGEDAPVGREIW